ncbi:hypothetical protein IFR04_009620 [Cadophora malorum]|uniref:Stress response RCI peptide n=1 Tax=Cadophora malorum TaxID=108018 RepID=A0A8H7W4U7_9HELO|nr:hypothetical protein IFR04_009620 [Cadophora malorum]
MCSADIFLGLIAILFPPLAVWVKCGICSADSLINICLCMLGFIPGLLHAWYIIAKHPEHDYDSVPNDAESGRVTYIIVDGNRRVAKPTRPQASSGGYGTTAPMAPPLHQNQNGTWNNNAAEGSSGGAVPPTYAEAVKGDNKIQTRD